ncbi:ASCH domain-containing protein [Georgenia thermotolerans]|uniref:ASCH domain-containing protein n=1 Tax=Georgenia thermotolerans TaxID=527326 RepID=A0A7J5UKL1_9MICO|nr:ASCH domain-containing protein [Georgenia thermotolerans]KAE8762897.1 ASCH domain-containing protein [Georgenia thermotolerans]
MWASYAAAHPAAVRACPDYTVERFGDSAELADALLGLVIDGPKRATAELVAAFAAAGEALPRVGSHWIACDGAGAPRVVLRSVELRVGTIATADEAFAWDEGEDDRSLASWSREHRRYWTRTCAAMGTTFSDDDEIVFERFQVVWPPELAD